MHVWRIGYCSYVDYSHVTIILAIVLASSKLRPPFYAFMTSAAKECTSCFESHSRAMIVILGSDDGTWLLWQPWHWQQHQNWTETCMGIGTTSQATWWDPVHMRLQASRCCAIAASLQAPMSPGPSCCTRSCDPFGRAPILEDRWAQIPFKARRHRQIQRKFHGPLFLGLPTLSYFLLRR